MMAEYVYGVILIVLVLSLVLNLDFKSERLENTVRLLLISTLMMLLLTNIGPGRWFLIPRLDSAYFVGALFGGFGSLMLVTSLWDLLILIRGGTK